MDIERLLKDSKKATFTGLEVKKKGQTRGRGSKKLRYGDDKVSVTVVTGFYYDRLCERSLGELDEIDLDLLAQRPVIAYEGRGKNARPVTVTVEDYRAAANELRESLTRSMKGENSSTTDHVYDPLVVDGVHVREGRVYKCVVDDPERECRCRNCNPDNPRAPIPGTIYLKGLKIQERVIEEAPNGPIPPAKSGPKTVAKKILRSKLSVSRFVSYALEPGSEFVLRVGKEN